MFEIYHDFLNSERKSSKDNFSTSLLLFIEVLVLQVQDFIEYKLKRTYVRMNIAKSSGAVLCSLQVGRNVVTTVITENSGRVLSKIEFWVIVVVKVKWMNSSSSAKILSSAWVLLASEVADSIVRSFLIFPRKNGKLWEDANL